jgi:uroporphyrinogen-III synthase
MRYVLLTRSASENLKLAKQINLMGIDTYSFPLIHLKELSIQWDALLQYSCIIVTSKFAAKIASQNIQHHINALVVGTESSEILRLNPFIKSINHFSNVHKLLASLPNYINDKFVYLRGNITKAQMPSFVDNYVIYNTSYTPEMNLQLKQKIINLEIQIIMLYSENSSKTFLSLCAQNKILNYINKLTVIALSKNIQKVVRPYVQKILYCKEPINSSMLELLCKNYVKIY